MTDQSGGRVASQDAGPDQRAGRGSIESEARQRLQYLLAVSPTIIYTTQASGSYACTFISENLKSIMGYSPQEMTTDPKCWPERLHPEDASRVFAEVTPLVKQGGGTVSYRFRHRDGHYIWIQDTFKVIRDEAGQPLELVGAWADITELKGARQRLQYLLAVSPTIIYTTQASGSYACTFISENLKSIMGYSPQEMTTDPKCWPARLHPEDASRVFAQVEPLIKQGGGTVTYRFRHRDGHFIWIQDTFKVIRDETGKPLELVGAWADITELKSARARLEYLLSVSPTIIYTTQASGDGYACTFVSENLRAIMGYSPQEMTTDPKCWPERLHPEDAPRVLAEVVPLIKQGGGTVAYRFRHRDGHYIWIQDTFKVIRDEAGQPLELVGAWADVTVRTEAERAALKANVELQETKRYLTRLLESSTDAIISSDKAGNVVLFNEGAEVLLGYRAEEVIGKRVSLLYGSEEGFRDVVREMRKRGGTASAFESMLRTKDGRDIPVLISASVLTDDSGQEIGTVGFATDLRERKRAEEALQKAHDELEVRVEERTVELKAARERMRYLMTIAPGIMYTNQASGKFTCTFVSDNVDPIMGFSAWEMLEDPKFWPSRVHPDDAPKVFAEVGKLIEAGGGTVEYRFRHRDGNYLWIQDTFKVIFDGAGKPQEVVGSWANISDRKHAERALSERLAIMKDLQALVAASPSVIYTTQVSGDFACTFVSENLKSTMGYAPWEMRDDPKFWIKHLHSDDANRVFAELDQRMAQGGGTVEYRFRHRNGHYIWIQDTFTVTRDNEGKPKELIGSWADISDRKRAETELERLAKEVELRNRFIRETFGRYLTDDVVATVLETPTGLQVGGEKRKVTMMMTDLRGFTSLSERLAPERVVAMLNRYLGAMVDVIKRYQGTIDEFIGDAIFVLFGAPVWQEDDAQRAVACAVAMQLAMEDVNEANRKEDLPEIEMGIGIHTGQVVLGNIGSAERMKYGVVGRHVNLTARIQSYTIGGQILISETTRREAGATLRLGKQTAIKAKGIEHPVTLCEVLGIGGRHRLFLAETADEMVSLPQPINVVAAVVEGSHLSGDTVKGRLTKLSLKQAEAELEHAVPALANLKIDVLDGEGSKIQGAVYGKVLGPGNGANATTLIRFTSLSPESEAFLRGILGGPEPARSVSESPRTVPTPPQAAPVPKAPESRPAGQQAPTPEAPAAPAVAKTVAPAALDGGQRPPAAALSGSGTAGPAASPPPPANAAPAMPARIDPPPPAGEKQPSPHNGADNRGVNITALMSSTKPAEPEKKKGWLRTFHRH